MLLVPLRGTKASYCSNHPWYYNINVFLNFVIYKRKVEEKGIIPQVQRETLQNTSIVFNLVWKFGWANEITIPVNLWLLLVLLTVKGRFGVQVNSCHVVCHHFVMEGPMTQLNDSIMVNHQKPSCVYKSIGLGCLDILYSAQYSIVLYFNRPIIINYLLLFK